MNTELNDAAEKFPINAATVLSKWIWKFDIPEFYIFNSDGTKRINQDKLLAYLINFYEWVKIHDAQWQLEQKQVPVIKIIEYIALNYSKPIISKDRETIMWNCDDAGALYTTAEVVEHCLEESALQQKQVPTDEEIEKLAEKDIQDSFYSSIAEHNEIWKSGYSEGFKSAKQQSSVVDECAGIWRYDSPKTSGGTRHFCEVRMKNGNVQRDIKTWIDDKWILEYDEDAIIKWLDESAQQQSSVVDDELMFKYNVGIRTT